MGTTHPRLGSPAALAGLVLLLSGCGPDAEPPPAPPRPSEPIVQWLLSPTYSFDSALALVDQHFAPEEGLAAFGDVVWLPVTAAADGRVDLRRFDPVAKSGVACARAALAGTGRRAVELEFVSDDALVATLDGAVIFDQASGGDPRDRGRRVQAELAAGDHELLVKIATVDVPWSFRVVVQTLP